MRWSIERRITTTFTILLLVLGCIGALGYWNTTQLISTAGWVEHTHEVLKELEGLLAHLLGAESGQRGYIITGNYQYLDSYYLSTHTINDKVNTIRKLTSDNSQQQQRIQALKPILEKRLMLLRETLTIRQQKGFQAAQQFIEQDVGRNLTNDIQRIVNAMISEENHLLNIRSKEANLTARSTILVVGTAGILALGLIPLAGTAINRDIIRRRRVEADLHKSEQKLKQWVGELEQRSSEISLLGELSDVLQACFTLDEAYTVLSELLQPLFPDTAGGVFLTSESKTLVEAVATWGDERACASLFTPTECWGLRRGRPYFLSDTQSRLRCHHVHPHFGAQTFCVPMMAQGEALGVLHLVASETGQLTQAKQLLATTVAEHIALALANLKLRETLKNQSIRDPLTGLFNRRYMEESLEREIRRAERKEQPLGVIMLDVDHFKRFNDIHGHEAGDIVLRELGEFLKSMIRGSDIACRYGGEEFIVLLPEAPLKITELRADQMRSGTKHLNLQYRRESLGAISLSLGVASYPQHGNTAETVIRAADAALYQAKTQGRDRVVIAE
ncbi:diguanylate cyclase with PAS/PAC and GAF sensors [Kalymmatonema gypsitolerans NIES-4073]|nr:diguanylate cyclase with PAS/PAC and GAF sensors [Scytonema sp. NIES-4073]